MPVQKRAGVDYQELVARAREREVFPIPEVVVQAYHQVTRDRNLDQEKAQALAAVLMQALPEGEPRECFAAVLQVMDIVQEKTRLALFAYGYEEIYEVAVSEAKFPPLPFSLKAAVGTQHNDFVTDTAFKEMQKRSGLALSIWQAEIVEAVSVQVEKLCEEFHEALAKLEELVPDKNWQNSWDDTLYPLWWEAFRCEEAPVYYEEGRRAAFNQAMRGVVRLALREYEKATG